MSRFRWTLLVLLICLPVAVLATGVPLPFVDARPVGAQPLRVAPGDVELAWLHTTTSWTTWERFVSGVARAQMTVPGLRVDDSRAYRSQTFEVPEVNLSFDGKPGRVRIRWYKLSSEATLAEWVDALAARDPAPVGIIGGGSSDRAADLARALARQPNWRGDRPLLLLTTATADDLVDATDGPPPAAGRFHPALLDVYDGRTFRFCFSNRQMAEATLDFVWDHPELRPQLFSAVAPLAVASGLAAKSWRDTERSTPTALRPHVFTLSWLDDPFSRDLNEQFKGVLRDKLRPRGNPDAGDLPVRFTSRDVPFSVGGMNRPNPYEARVAGSLLEEFRSLPAQRSLVVLPTSPTQARRVLRAVADAVPAVGQRMVAVNGDGISVNAVYRDGEFSWPVHAIPVPLVLFTHNNPVAWDDPAKPAGYPPGCELSPPTTTEDVLHFAEMARVLAEGCFGIQATDQPDTPPPPPSGLAARADELATRIRGRCPAFFDAEGNRLGGTGEHVVVVRPRPRDGPAPDPLARIEVFRRGDDRRWEPVRTLDIDQWRTRADATTGGGK